MIPMLVASGKARYATRVALAVTLLALVAPWAAAQDHPRNVIIMIADGCGFRQVEAADRWRYGAPRMSPQHYFPTYMAMQTYSLDGRPYEPEAAWASFDWVTSGATDSAAAATAMATSRKSFNGAIGVIPLARDEEGKVTATQAVENLSERAERLGKASGVVTSVQFCHATPAGFVAHSATRGNYPGIAREMLFESAVDVIMGCGHPWYNSNGDRVDKADYAMVGGPRAWIDATTGRPAADADGDGVPDPWAFIDDREEFIRLASGDAPDRVLGVPKVRGTLSQEREGDADAAPFVVPRNQDVPTLVEMTRAALNVLDDDPDGFFLMIEGGAVDWACHANQLGRMIEEQLEFVDAVTAVIEWVETNSNWDETLLVVTADHETGFLTPAGSGERDGNVVWSEAAETKPGELPTMEWHSGGHTNSLVPFAAIGAGSERYRDRTIGEDPVRGPYIDNTAVAKVVLGLWSE